jgi:hypothetical protein
MFVWLGFLPLVGSGRKGLKKPDPLCLSGRFLASNGVGVKEVKSETLMFVWLASSIKLVLSEKG